MKKTLAKKGLALLVAVMALVVVMCISAFATVDVYDEPSLTAAIAGAATDGETETVLNVTADFSITASNGIDMIPANSIIRIKADEAHTITYIRATGSGYSMFRPGYNSVKNVTLILGNNVTLSGNNKQRLVLVYAGSKFVLDGGTITNGSAESGGAISAAAGTTIDIRSGLITTCKSTSASGGAIVLSSSETAPGTFKMSGGTISNCESKTHSGAVALTGGYPDIQITGGTIQNCTAGTYGGVGYWWNKGEANITGIKFLNNIAKTQYTSGSTNTYLTGGALVLENGKYTFGEGVLFKGNEAKAYRGGAIASLGADVTVNGAHFIENTASATDGCGGAIAVRTIKSAGYEIKGDSLFQGNTAGSGGGAFYAGYASSAPIIIISGKFVYNSAKNGGAVSIAYGILTISGGEFKMNYASTNGGAVYSYTTSSGSSQIHIAGGTFSKNGTNDIYAGGSANTRTIKGAPSIENYAMPESTTISKAGELINSTPIGLTVGSLSDGTSLVVSGTATVQESDASKFTINGAGIGIKASPYFSDNSLCAELEEASLVQVVGDDVYDDLADAIQNASSGAEIQILGNIIVDEPIEIDKNLTIKGNSGTTVTYNTAATAGKRSIFTIDGNAEVTVDGLTIDGSNKIGIFTVKQGSTLNLINGASIKRGTTNDTICGPVSGNLKHGAGIYNNGTLNIVEAYISGCYAGSGNGGGIFNDANGVVTFTKGAIAGCRAWTSGGGVYNRGTFTMHTDAIIGGGKALTSSNYYVALIYGNSCAAGATSGTLVNGAGVYNAGTFTMEGGTIAYNAVRRINQNDTYESSGVDYTFTEAQKKEFKAGAINNNGTLKIRSSSVIENNICDSKDGTLTQEIYNNSTLSVSGSPKIQEIYLPKSNSIAVEADKTLESTAKVNIKLATDFASGATVVSNVATEPANGVITLLNTAAEFNYPDKFGLEFISEKSNIIFNNVTYYVRNDTTGTKYPTLKDAVEEANIDDVIILSGNTTEPVVTEGNFVITINKSLTIKAADSTTPTVRYAGTSAASGVRSLIKVTENATVTIEGITINSNLVTGGLEIDEGATVILDGGTSITKAYKGSTATTGAPTGRNHGAGVYNAGTLTITNGNIYGCYAGNTCGGGIYNDTTGVVTFTKGAIACCRAFTSGGGVYNKGSFTMYDDAIIGGNGYSVANSYSSANKSLGNCTAAGDDYNTVNNSAGVYNDGTFTMEGGEIAYNTVIKLDTDGMFKSKDQLIPMTSDSGEYRAGGVENNGTFTMKGSSEISKNKAASYGSAVYNRTGGTFTMQDNATIKENEAQTSSTIFNSNEFNMKGGSIVDNIIAADPELAYSLGSAVQLFGENAKMTMTGGTISGNTGGTAVIHFRKDTQELHISGNSIIENNTLGGDDTDNVGIGITTKAIRYFGELGENAKIEINAPEKIELTRDGYVVIGTLEDGKSDDNLDKIVCASDDTVTGELATDGESIVWKAADDVVITVKSVGEIGTYNKDVGLITFKAPKIAGMQYNLPAQSHIVETFTGSKTSLDHFFIGYAEYENDELKNLWEEDGTLFAAEDGPDEEGNPVIGLNGKKFTVGWAKLTTAPKASIKLPNSEVNKKGIRFVTVVESNVFDEMKVPFISLDDAEEGKVGVIVGYTVYKDYGTESPTEKTQTGSVINDEGERNWFGDHFVVCGEGQHAFSLGLALSDEMNNYGFTPHAFLEIHYSASVNDPYSERKHAPIPVDEEKDQPLVRTAKYVAVKIIERFNADPDGNAQYRPFVGVIEKYAGDGWTYDPAGNSGKGKFVQNT